MADEMREEHRRRVLIRCYAFRTNSGSLATFAAIRPASSLVSSLAADLRLGSLRKKDGGDSPDTPHAAAQAERAVQWPR